MKSTKYLHAALCFGALLLLTSIGQATPPTQLTIPSVSPSSLAAWESSILQAAQICHERYTESIHGDSLNTVLSEQTLTEMVDAVADLGFSVIDEDMALDMRNPEPLINFGAALSQGTATEAAYYTLYSDGHIGLSILTPDTVTSLSATFTAAPEVYLSVQYPLTDISYTNKGWLIYKRDQSGSADPKQFNVDPHTLVRVAPLSQELRQLCQTYITPIGYSETNLFTINWDLEHFDQLDLSSLYAMLFGMHHDGETLTWYTAKKYYDQLEGTELFLIPETEFETITQDHLALTTDQIRSSSDYCSARKGYYFLGWQTGYYNVVPRLPMPEVVAAQTNPDGTLTMQVDAVFPWYGTDCAFSHQVTVLPHSDGSFQYVSNTVKERTDNIFPQRQLEFRRKSMIQLTQTPLK